MMAFGYDAMVATGLQPDGRTAIVSRGARRCIMLDVGHIFGYRRLAVCCLGELIVETRRTLLLEIPVR